MYSLKPLIIALLLTQAAVDRVEAQLADGDGTLWAVGISALADDEASRNLALSLDVAVAEGTWVSALAARSQSPRERADVTADTLSLGLDHRFGRVGVRVGAERWGDPGVVESVDYRAAVYVHAERATIEVGLERRDIDITATFVGLDGREVSRKVPLSAAARSLGLRVRASDRIMLRFAVEGFDYPHGLALLPRIDSLNLLGTSMLTLANSFVSETRSVGLELALGNKVLGFHAARDRSAIDRSELESFDAALLVPIGRRIDLELSAGRSSSDLFRSGVYGGLLVLVYGGG